MTAMGAVLMREGPNGRKKLVIEGPKIIYAENKFSKRSNCHSIKMN